MFRKRLSEAMSIRQMKAADLADKTGIAKSTLSNYMTGRMKPKTKNLSLIAKALGVQEAWLMGYDIPMESDQKYYEPDTAAAMQEVFDGREDLRLLFDAARDLPPEQVQMVAQMIQGLKNAEK